VIEQLTKEIKNKLLEALKIGQMHCDHPRSWSCSESVKIEEAIKLLESMK
jgi:hypothetical protein